MGRMMVSSEGYRAMTRLVKAVAGDTGHGRLAVCMEGGYSKVYVPFCVLAIVEELSGCRSRVVDPFLPSINLIPTVRRIAAEVEEAVDRVVAVQRPYWDL
jgi:acetoin utilization deacetylase AcuC-like enzyme